MILKKVILKRFKRLKDKVVELSPGLNIIKGSDNEIGKSTLRMAIVEGLYQDPSTRKQDVASLTTWGETRNWRVELHFEVGGKDYTLIKDLDTHSVELVNVTDGGRLSDRMVVARKIADLTGCPSAAFFHATACVRQEELIHLIPSDATPSEQQVALGAITSRLRATVSGGEGLDVSSIVTKLQHKVRRRDAGGPYARIQELRSKIAQLERDKAELEKKVDLLLENRKQLVKTEAELFQIAEMLAPKRELLNKNYFIGEKESQIRANKRQFETYNRAKTLKEELGQLDRLLIDYPFSAETEPDVTFLRSCGDKKAELQQQLQQCKMEFSSARRNLAEKLAWGFGVCLTLGFLALALTNWLAWFGVVVGVLLIILATYLRKKRITNIAKLDAEIRDSSKSLSEMDEKEKDILAKLKFEKAWACLEAYEEYQKQRVRRRETEVKLTAITAEQSWDDFKQENEDIDIQISATKKELEKLLIFKKEPLELQSLEREVEELEGRKNELERQKGGLEQFFLYSDADPDQLATVTEELDWHNKELGSWQRRNKVFEVTCEGLEKAHLATLSRATDVLKDRLARYICVITDGRYEQVDVDERALSISACCPEKGELVKIEQLSRATQDQFYIAARLALVSLVTQGKNPPLLLDDPFVNYHPKRLGKIINFLKELTKHTQILLFTCSDAYDSAGNIVFLG